MHRRVSQPNSAPRTSIHGDNGLHSLIDTLEKMDLSSSNKMAKRNATYLFHQKNIMDGNLSNVVDAVSEITTRKFSPDIEFFNLLIKQLAAHNQYSLAKRLYQIIIRSNVADTNTFNVFMNAAKKNNDFDSVYQAFSEAKRTHHVDVLTFSILIESAGMKRDMTSVHSAFNEAKESKLMDTRLFSSFIHAAGKNNHYAAANLAYKEAKNLGLVNQYTYNNLIIAASKNGDVDTARLVFKDADQKDKITQTIMLDALVRSNALDEAEKFYKDNKFDTPIQTLRKNTYYEINLHDHSYGSSYIGLRLAIKYLASLNDSLIAITITVGRGSHSKLSSFDANGDHPVKQAVVRLAKELSPECIKLSKEKNPGQLLMCLNVPMMKQEKTAVLIAEKTTKDEKVSAPRTRPLNVSLSTKYFSWLVKNISLYNFSFGLFGKTTISNMGTTICNAFRSCGGSKKR